jgi:DNA polymerase-3 subunit alpha
MAFKKDDFKSIPFVNLRTLTHFSMLLAVGTVKDHVKAAQAAGHAGVSIADNGTMAGSIQLYNLARELNLPFAMGVNLYVTEDINLKDSEHKYDRLIVYAKNWTGYQNLCRLVSISSLEDHLYYRTRVSFDEIFEHKEGLVVSSSDMSSPFGHAILNETSREEELFDRFHKEMGTDFHVEISLGDHSHRWNKEHKAFIKEENKQEIVNRRMMEIAKTRGVKCYLSMPSYMPKKELYAIQKIAISNSHTGKDGWHFHEPQYTMSVEELYERRNLIAPYISDELFKEFCANTMEIVNKCQHLKLEFKPLLLKVPYAEHPVNKDPEIEKKLLLMEKYFATKDPEFAELLKVSRHNESAALVEKYIPELAEYNKQHQSDDALRTTLKIIFANGKINLQNDAYRKRLTKELQVIQRNGVVKFCDYFLPIEDVVLFHRNNGFERGFGRGSGGSSLVCYAMDISDVDCLRFDLDFDRFITLERLGRYDFSIPGFSKD